MALTTWKRGLMIAAPLLLFCFSLLHGVDEWLAHGTPEGDEWIRYLSTIQSRWLALHVAGLGLFPLVGLTVLWMLPPRQLASQVSQVAFAAFIVLYPAFDALVGLGSFILIHYRQTLSVADQAVLDPVIKSLFYDQSGVAFRLATAASISWSFGTIAAAVALWRTSGWRVGLPLAIAALALTVNHAPPYGTITGLMLGLTVWQYLTHKRHQPLRATSSVATA